ncbi:hypothetical protein ACKWTF_001463 [Chironomus riparius]
MYNQDYYTLRNQCLLSGKLFEDEFFPATSQSLYKKDSEFLHGTKDPYFNEWLRPKQICKDPQFFKNGFSTDDIKQGYCKDCWFLAAITNLTSNKKKFSEVVRGDNSFENNYAGIFHFKFWQYGEWIDVVIDDRLPTFKAADGKIKLSYASSSDQDEFWSALLEKAFAKLHGSYEALGISGTYCEAAEDMTSGVCQKFCLKDKENCLKFHKCCTYNSINFCQLQNFFNMGNFMSCFIRLPQEAQKAQKAQERKTKENLVMGHSFAITKIARTTNGDQLIQLKNPWGRYEWNGAWSDDSETWKNTSEALKTVLGYKNANDGYFFISYEDFHKYFDVIEICFLKFPYSLLKVESQMKCFVSIARKDPRLFPIDKETTNHLLTFKLNIAETICFEDFKKMINFAAYHGEPIMKKQNCQAKFCQRCPRFYDQWNGSQMDIYRIISREEEFYIRIYFCCVSHNDLIILKCIAVHIRIIGNCVELYKSKCTKIEVDSYMTRLINIRDKELN